MHKQTQTYQREQFVFSSPQFKDGVDWRVDSYGSGSQGPGCEHTFLYAFLPQQSTILQIHLARTADVCQQTASKNT